MTKCAVKSCTNQAIKTTLHVNDNCILNSTGYRKDTNLYKVLTGNGNPENGWHSFQAHHGHNLFRVCQAHFDALISASKKDDFTNNPQNDYGHYEISSS